MLYLIYVLHTYKYKGKDLDYVEIIINDINSFSLYMHLENAGWSAQNLKKENGQIILTFVKEKS